MSDYRIYRTDKLLLCRYYITTDDGFPLWYTATRWGAERWIRRDQRWHRRQAEQAAPPNRMTLVGQTAPGGTTNPPRSGE